MKSNQWETDLLNLYFTNVDVANVGDAAGLQNSATAGSLYLSLHTAYPGEAGVQNTSEAAYTSYARKAVARSTSEWTTTGNTITTDNANAFPACTGLSETEYFVGIGRQISGATELDYICPLGTEMGEATATVADVLTLPGHTLVNDDRAAVFVLPKVAIPTGLTAGTIYWVVSVSGDTFSLASTQGGAAINITVAGACLVYKMVGLAVSNGITPTIAAGALTIKEEQTIMANTWIAALEDVSEQGTVGGQWTPAVKVTVASDEPFVTQPGGPAAGSVELQLFRKDGNMDETMVANFDVNGECVVRASIGNGEKAPEARTYRVLTVDSRVYTPGANVVSDIVCHKPKNGP